MNYCVVTCSTGGKAQSKGCLSRMIILRQTLMSFKLIAMIGEIGRSDEKSFKTDGLSV